MGTLQDALKAGLGPSSPLQAADAPDPLPVGVAALPRPAGSAWAEALRADGLCPDAEAPVATYVQRTAGRLKELDGQGRKREARELARLRDEFLRLRERRAWEAVKARFEELEFPEKAYRAIKQEGGDAERVLARLFTRRAESWRGLAAAKLRDQLLQK